MKLLLHVGMNRTGTSAMQRAFCSHQELLMDCGIAYPAIGRGRRQAHHNLAWEVCSHEKFSEEEGTWHALKEASRNSKCRAYLVSSEVFCNLADPFVQDLARRILDTFDCMVIIYTRNQLDVIQSMYMQNLSQGAYIEPNEFAGRFLTDRPSIERWRVSPQKKINYSYQYDRFSDAFGDTNIKLLPYEEFKGDLTASLMEAAGYSYIPSLAANSNQRYNSSCDPADLPILRKLLETLGDKGLPPVEMGKIIKNAYRAHGTESGSRLIPKSLALSIFNEFRSTNEVLIKRGIIRPVAEYLSFPETWNTSVDVSLANVVQVLTNAYLRTYSRP